MAGSMEGKVALVTGGGRAVGRGIALDMARAGAAVIVNDLGSSIRGDAAADPSPAQQGCRRRPQRRRLGRRASHGAGGD